MTPIEEELIAALEQAGIKIPRRDGMPQPIAAFEAVMGTELEGAFASIVSRMSNRREWLADGMPPFYQMQLWKRVRYLALAKHGNRCQCCGASPSTGAVLHVDHVKPRSKHPELSLSVGNLQVLCADCNIGKSNVDETDWRGT